MINLVFHSQKLQPCIIQTNQKGCSATGRLTKCLTIDDTDFEKSTYKSEHVGKIWSHTKHGRFFGFKGLFLGYWDDKSFFSLDFSLHKEKGKNKKIPFGLAGKQKKKQFSKRREKGSCGTRREQELVKDKISTAILFVKKVIIRGIQVDYLLMDIWFFCEAFLKIGLLLKARIDIIAMVKMAKAKYAYQDNTYTAKELSQLMKQRKKVKWAKTHCFYCAEVEVEYKSEPLKLYFCKTSKRSRWKLVLSTYLKLSILKAYKM